MKPSTASANASTVTRSRIFGMLGVVPRRRAEIGEEVEGAGDEHGAILSRPPERRCRVRHRFDLGEMMRGEVCEVGRRFVATQSSNERALPAAELGQLASSVFDEVAVEPDPAAALALAQADPPVLVTGSLYLLADLEGCAVP